MAEHHPERRRTERRQRAPSDLDPIYERLNQGDARMTELEGSLRENTALTKQTNAAVDRIDANTAGMASLYADMKKGTSFLCRLALGVKFVLDITNRYWRAVLVLVFLAYVLVSLLTHTPPAWPKWFIALLSG